MIQNDSKGYLPKRPPEKPPAMTDDEPTREVKDIYITVGTAPKWHPPRHSAPNALALVVLDIRRHRASMDAVADWLEELDRNYKLEPR